jgi:hypothetical protein
MSKRNPIALNLLRIFKGLPVWELGYRSDNPD